MWEHKQIYNTLKQIKLNKMKRFLTLIVAIMMFMLAMAQSSGIVLSYNKGKELKFYSSDQIAKAIEDAEVNDTIYFGTGTFSLNSLPRYNNCRQITKPLVFIGSGAHSGGTFFNLVSNLYLNIDSSIDEGKKRLFSFEGIDFGNSYYILPASDIEVLQFVNSVCKFADYNDLSSYYQPVIVEFKIDRCQIGILDMRRYKTKHINVNNSKISSLYGGCDSSSVAVFDHCFMEGISKEFIGIIKYSLIRGIEAGNDTQLEDCYWYADGGNSYKINCKQIKDSNVKKYDDDPSILGNCEDGTVYGTLGGKTPYTLYPQYPTIDTSIDPNTNKAKSYVEYDSLNKKLNITVKRLGE